MATALMTTPTKRTWKILHRIAATIQQRTPSRKAMPAIQARQPDGRSASVMPGRPKHVTSDNAQYRCLMLFHPIGSCFRNLDFSWRYFRYYPFPSGGQRDASSREACRDSWRSSRTTAGGILQKSCLDRPWRL